MFDKIFGLFGWVYEFRAQDERWFGQLHTDGFRLWGLFMFSHASEVVTLQKCKKKQYVKKEVKLEAWVL